MTAVIYLLKTYLIFFSFFIIITLFGGIIVFIILIKWNKKKLNLSLLEFCFISFAVGILFYITFCYILCFFKIFNFYSAYLPILVISIVFLIILYKKQILHKIWVHLIIQLKSNCKILIEYSLMLSIIFLFQFLAYLPMILQNTALLTADPYYWTRQIQYLNQNGMINYNEHDSTYPWGFIIYCSGQLLISPDFTTTYYFMKFACFPFLNLYIVVLFSISKRLFKERFLIFFCLLAVLSNIYFLYRTFSFLSSALSVLLILISLIIFLTEVPNYFLGFIIPIIFLFNPTYLFFFILALIIFFSYKILLSQKDRKMIFKEFIKITIIALSFLSIYGLSIILIYEGNLISRINSFLQSFSIKSISISLTPIVIEEIDILYLLLGTIYFIIFMFLPIWGVFIKTYTIENNDKKDFYLFVKISVICVFVVVYILPIFIKISFFETYYTRILEAFLPCIILLSGISLKKLQFFSENLWNRIKLSRVKIRKWSEKDNFFSKLLSLPNLVIFSIILLSFLNHIYVRENLEWDYRYDDSIITCIFYIENNIEASSNIGFTGFPKTHSPIGLLINYNLFSYSGNYNLTILEFINFTQTNNIGFFITNISNYNEVLRTQIQNGSLFDKLAGGISNLEYHFYRIL